MNTQSFSQSGLSVKPHISRLFRATKIYLSIYLMIYQDIKHTDTDNSKLESYRKDLIREHLELQEELREHPYSSVFFQDSRYVLL